MVRQISTLCAICFFSFSGCISTYFKTPNDMYKTSATIYADDGTEKKGELTIQFETGFDPESITLFHKETGETEKLNMKSIKYYKINKSSYFPKKMDLDLNGKYYFLFVERLTNENSRIQLYELHQLYKSTATGEERKLYFISLPTFSE
jgi:hypothetical protein